MVQVTRDAGDAGGGDSGNAGDVEAQLTVIQSVLSLAVFVSVFVSLCLSVSHSLSLSPLGRYPACDFYFSLLTGSRL